MKKLIVFAFLLAGCSIKSPDRGFGQDAVQSKGDAAIDFVEGSELKPAVSEKLLAIPESGSCRAWQYVPLRFFAVTAEAPRLERRQEVIGDQIVVYTDLIFNVRPDVNAGDLEGLRQKIAKQVAVSPNCNQKVSASQIELGAFVLNDATSASLSALSPQDGIFSSQATGFAPDRIEWRLAFDGSDPATPEQITRLLDGTKSQARQIGSLHLTLNNRASEVAILVKGLSLGRTSMKLDASTECMRRAYATQVRHYHEMLGLQPIPVDPACLNQPQQTP